MTLQNCYPKLYITIRKAEKDISLKIVPVKFPETNAREASLRLQDRKARSYHHEYI